MTVKQKFDKIDQSKLLQAQVDILKSMQAKTDNFKTKDKEALEKIEMGLDKIIAKLKESNPDALKSTARKTSTAGKAKAKTTSPSTTGGKNNVMALAKKIRKPNESWADAQKRAKASLQGDIRQASKVVTSELDKLKAFINRRKQLKGIAGTDLLRDATRKAKPKGSRKSKEGNVYYEYRENRTDRLAPNYPKNAPLLAGGGGVDNLPTNLKTRLKNLKGRVTISKAQALKAYELHSERGMGGSTIGYEMFDAKNKRDSETFGDLAIDLGRHYSKFAYGGGVDGIEEDIDMTDNYVLKVNKGVRPNHELSEAEWMAKNNESMEARDYTNNPRRSYEIGGNLAGHLGGGVQIRPTMLDGTSGTHYTGLVGETGALSSGEMFARGGGVGDNVLGLEKGDIYKVIDEYHLATDKAYTFIDYVEKYGDVVLKSLPFPPNPKKKDDFVYISDVSSDGVKILNNEEIGKLISYKYKYFIINNYDLGGGVDGYVIVEGFDSYKNRPLYHVVDKSDDGEYVGEWHTSRKEAEEELKDLVQGYARGGSTDHKYLNHSEDYEVRYAKGRNRHGYGNLKFHTGGAVMANQQVIDDASQHYVNYYLNEGATAGMFKDGGAIKNQYAGRTPEDVWNSWSLQQKIHFTKDHKYNLFGDQQFSTEERRKVLLSEFKDLSRDLRMIVQDHVEEGQYAKGAMVPSKYNVSIQFPSKSSRSNWASNDNVDIKVVAKNKVEAEKKALEEFSKKFPMQKPNYVRVTKDEVSSFDNLTLKKGGMMPKLSTSKHRND